MDGVCIGEEEVSAASGLCSDPACVALAGEASAIAQVKRRRVQEDDSLVSGCGFRSDLAGPVGGGVVDDDQFPLFAEEKAGFGLDQQRGETFRERTLLVAGRNDYGEFEAGLFRRIRGRLAVCIGHDFVL